MIQIVTSQCSTERQWLFLGFGSQGHAHAMNLKESGANVVVGLRPGSAHTAKAEAAGLKVVGIEEAAEAGDIVMILTPDELQAKIYKEQVEKHMKPGNVLAFAHGFNIHFNQIVPSKDLDVIMIAPKGPGHTVRSQYVEGKGVPSLIAVYQDASGKAKGLRSGLCLRNRSRQSWNLGNYFQGRN